MKRSALVLLSLFMVLKGGAQSELELFESFQGTAIKVESIVPENYTILKFGNFLNEGMSIDTASCALNINNPFIKGICHALNNKQNIWPSINPLKTHTVHLNHALCDEGITSCSVNYKAFSKEKEVESLTINVIIEGDNLRTATSDENRVFLAEKLSFQALIVLFRVGLERPGKDILNTLYSCRQTNLQFRMDINCLAEQLRSLSEAELEALNTRLSLLF